MMAEIRWFFAAHNRSFVGLWSQETMKNYMIALGLAVFGTSLIGLLLIRGAQNRRENRRSSSDGSGSNDVYAGDSASFSDGGGHHSVSDHSAGAGESGVSGDSVGGDSGGGGDGGSGSD
jgi:hypothetical protein